MNAAGRRYGDRADDQVRKRIALENLYRRRIRDNVSVERHGRRNRSLIPSPLNQQGVSSGEGECEVLQIGVEVVAQTQGAEGVQQPPGWRRIVKPASRDAVEIDNLVFGTG